MSRVSDNLYDGAITNLTVTFTTDDPGITPDGAVVIADGDDATAIRAEVNNLAVETANKINAILDSLRASGVVKDTGDPRTVSGASVGTIADVTVAFTTDDPSITANSAITIADGDDATAANIRTDLNEAVVELSAKVNAILAALRVVGIIT